MFRFAVAIASLAVAFAGCAEARRVDPAALTREMAATLRQKLPSAKITIEGPLTLKVEGDVSMAGQVNLDRVFAFCSENAAADCAVMKRDFVSGIVESQSETVVTKASLRLVVRPQEYVDEMQVAMTAAGKGQRVISIPVADGLAAVLMADFPRSARTVSSDDLPDLSLEQEEALTLAKAQLLRALPPLPAAAEVRKTLTGVTDVDYAASIMLSDGWDALAKEVGPGLFLAIPDDRFALIGVADGTAAIAKLRSMVADDFKRAQRGISPEIYRRMGGKWVVER
jgi:hypothetical protein